MIDGKQLKIEQKLRLRFYLMSFSIIRECYFYIKSSKWKTLNT